MATVIVVFFLVCFRNCIHRPVCVLLFFFLFLRCCLQPRHPFNVHHTMMTVGSFEHTRSELCQFWKSLLRRCTIHSKPIFHAFPWHAICGKKQTQLRSVQRTESVRRLGRDERRRVRCCARVLRNNKSFALAGPAPLPPS